jgi:hypothetical protein
VPPSPDEGTNTENTVLAESFYNNNICILKIKEVAKDKNKNTISFHITGMSLM